MRVQVVENLSEVGATQWNALLGHGNPFLKHEFLQALERSGFVGRGSGWEPRHLVLRDQNSTLIGAVPLRLKHHSCGEYVFDRAWASTYARAGGHYPKLVAAVLFTPVAGPRLLVAADTDRARVGAVADIPARERRGVAEVMDELGEHLPFKAVLNGSAAPGRPHR